MYVHLQIVSSTGTYLVPACDGSMEGYAGAPPAAPGGRPKKLGPVGRKGAAPPMFIWMRGGSMLAGTAGA